ncbi:hypothetical protein A3I99_03470 [Candidatus Kaiserbacteria bacterium RIFCSPLOWO2_02_FULL_45_11b]|uniref:Uncharacterized protein n=1 Tax=Candidatus Kaiserbacteria bacterium RIFCSPLOWO2_12_FULL_45_26 TaxID=1798525 RepID=A0A1F6FH04_9BACT|nr:MAG: hypothetical protein A2Z56_02685 [Candidatus Kaiserbacteria bacterium RIFCSPHIGHO2_12_45_16]OGG69985.1 MAG: hypothetical protein A2929_02345 [Candidatus Kaiserbacteria bacterium RIFCSPLOWO2_01_FULL_45_25]OGG83654.1 MAG: hypothetical protein A3I99_03470 [Candidatus Kaiserbacteria bacterium RIFCSPLOWO2_02_FULL_45_11b]OGG85145.1 MAG: hypothetical protein A3G90_03755 [Candidatus Kaiserbacteria bacterium RIFCSPLOWO2_12_FULL_45_26]
MNDFVQITDEDRANIERFVGRRLSTVKDDEKAIFENLLNRGLIGWPQKIAGTEDRLIGQSLLPHES